MTTHPVRFLNDLFKANTTVGVSKFRIYLLRFIYVVTFIFLGIMDAWKEIFYHADKWDTFKGVSYSFWAAYSTLMLLGLRYPLKMVPLLLLQFFYKLIWLLVIAFPLFSSHQLKGSFAEGTANIFFYACLHDIIIIPWSYVVKSYFRVLAEPSKGSIVGGKIKRRKNDALFLPDSTQIIKTFVRLIVRLYVFIIPM